PGMMDRTYENIEVLMTSVSLVYIDYTFGIGTSEHGDYIWIAPHASYPTFFNEISVQGMIMDKESLDQMAADFQNSLFSDIKLQEVIDLASDFEFVYSGVQDHFLIVNELEYVNTISVEGDVIDTITPSDLDKVSDPFSMAGMDWIKSIVGNIGEGCALLSESRSTMYDNRFWILLYPLDIGSKFEGICDIEVSQSSFSMIDYKSDLDSTSFEPDAGSVSFVVNVGIIIATHDGDYEGRPISSLWNMMGTSAYTQVDSVKVTGYGVVVDLQSIATSVNAAFGTSDSQGVLSTISTFKNPAFIFIIDENFSAILGDDISIWNYAAVCIVPNYVHDASAFRYLNVEGTAYDMSHYFGSDSPMFRIPLIIADSCEEVDAEYQNVDIKDMRSDDLEYRNIGGANGAYVSFDTKPIGTTFQSIINAVGGLSATAMKLLPLDLGLYLGFQRDGEGLYYVPVIYLSSGKGDSYMGMTGVDIQGMYIDFSYYSNSVINLTNYAADEDNTSMFLPTGFVLAFSLDKITLDLEDAMVIGPEIVTSKNFTVQYSFDPSLNDDEGIVVDLYWTNSDGWIGTTWNHYGRDPTPGDGLFPVDYDKLDGDNYYGWFIRVKNEDHMADNKAPGFWDNAEFTSRVNLEGPDPVYQRYPLAPSPGSSLTLRWETSDDPFFDHYEIFYGTSPDFVPSSSNRIGSESDRNNGEMDITGAQPGKHYYLIVRVVDTDGHYTDSNMAFTRTFETGDSGETMDSATLVMAGTAWTEETTMLFDEKDLFKVYLNAGERLTVNMIGNMLGGGDLYAYDVDGQYLTSSTTLGVTEQIQFTASESGYYFIMVYSPNQGTDWYTLWFIVG
ncbi:MAG: pre-peptidase C-terminal domain-containing protein, partial [Methanomassiliicoccales archaeon]